VAWQFSGRDHEARERRTLRIIACSFFALAAYIAVEALRSLFGGGGAEPSTVGIVLAVASLAVMPGLSFVQRRTGRELGSLSAVADSKQALICSYMSAVLLVGLAANSLFGWSWADPTVALVIAGLALREGIDAWRGDTCCAVPQATKPSGRRDAELCEDGCCDKCSGSLPARGVEPQVEGRGPHDRDEASRAGP
jgi:Co/Zn/Cd efflux system component